MEENSKLIETISEEQLAGWYSKIQDNTAIYVDFYTDLLKNYKAPMLEINCGAGEILSRLQERGIYCDGLEASAQQLDVCNRKLVEAGKQAQLYNTELEGFTFPKKYNTIFIPYGSFCIIDCFESALHCLESIASSLENGGVLIMDIFIPWKRICSKKERVWKIGHTKTDPQTGEEFVFSFFDDFDLAAQIRTVHSKYEIFQNGEIKSVRLDTVQTRWYSDSEFKMLLEKAGFDNVSFKKIFAKSDDDYSTLFIASKLK